MTELNLQPLSFPWGSEDVAEIPNPLVKVGSPGTSLHP